jgi:hypothetical protein
VKLTNSDVWRTAFDVEVAVRFGKTTRKVYVDIVHKTDSVRIHTFSDNTIVFRIDQLPPSRRAWLPFVIATEKFVQLLVNCF